MVEKRKRTEEELNAIRQSWTVGDDNILRWARKPAKGNVGDPVGFSKTHGGHRCCYLYLNGKYVAFVESNVIWFLRAGEWPYHEIDHIDRNPENNAMSNLRIADRSENTCNTRLRSDNKTGAKGVYRYGDKWKVQIWKNSKCFSVGTFSNFEEAKNARIDAMNKHHGSFAFEGVA